MKITDLRVALVFVPFPGPVYPAWRAGGSQEGTLATVLEIDTDAGITGLGTAFVHGRREMIETVEHMVKPYLVGRDPFAVERHIHLLRTAQLFGAKPWLVEIALWDIIGKAAGLPLYRLWGGFQDRVKAYASTAEVRPPARRADDIRRYRDEGFRAVKLRLHHDDPRDDLRVVEACLRAANGEMQIMTDANQGTILPYHTTGPRWSYETARWMARELGQMGVVWLEEPLPRFDFDNIARLSAEVDIPIAGGEANAGLHEFKWLIERRCYDILQPDATLSEGIFQLRKVAGMAEAFGLQFVPHTWADGVGMAANLQLAASVPNCGWLEFPHDPPNFTTEAFQALLVEPLRVDPDGCVRVPEGPGLGVELNRDVLNRFRVA
jgi:L-alanine-DL-glutamate epimerase-like enolase superfamily enzyme